MVQTHCTDACLQYAIWFVFFLLPDLSARPLQPGLRSEKPTQQAAFKNNARGCGLAGLPLLLTNYSGHEPACWPKQAP